LTEIQNCRRCQKINVKFQTMAGGTWDVEVFGVYIANGHTHLAFKHNHSAPILGKSDSFDNAASSFEDQAVFPVEDYLGHLAIGLEATSEIGSMVSAKTAGSAPIFKPFMNSESIQSEATFDKLTALGRKEHWLLQQTVVRLKEPL